MLHQTAAALALTAVSALYADAKFSLSRDVRDMFADKRFGKRLNARLQELGDDVTLYRMYQLCDQDAEALWFEGRTWSYAEALKSE
jgi:hypothetical protein